LDHSCGMTFDGKKVLLVTKAHLAFYIRRGSPALDTRKEGGLSRDLMDMYLGGVL
jgi:hypothetical protein